MNTAIARTPWFARKFAPVIDAGTFPSLLERLRGTPARVAEIAHTTPREIVTAHVGGTWSIQENLGHLGDLEPLWDVRLDEFLAGAAVLKPADLENRATHGAGHDRARIEELVARFRSRRSAIVARLRGFTASDLERTAQHPRLQQPMNVVGLCHFVAEHDDHHLARASEVAETLRAGLQFTVQPFAPRWQDEVRALVLAIQNDEYGLGLSFNDQPDLTDIERAFTGSGGAFWLALSAAGDLVGTAGLERLRDGDGVVRKMFVRDGWRGKRPGVAQRLMDQVLAHARRLGLRRLLLDTPAHAVPAQRFYERHGFVARPREGVPPGCHFIVREAKVYELVLVRGESGQQE
jgi:GNAT superfamily N-acetyltransferase